MKTIVLFDQLVGGHHYAFIKLFAKYLGRLNYKVLLLYPEAASVVKGLDEEGENTNFIIASNIQVKKRKCSKLGRFNQAYLSLLAWIDAKYTIKEESKKFGIRVDGVFICWLDSFLANYLPYQLVDLAFPYKWTGLFFHPWYLFNNPGPRISISSRDSVLRCKNMLNVAIHDEFLEPLLSLRIGKNTIVFPEIADSTPPESNSEIAEKVIQKKKKRLAVGIIGLARRKGLLHFIQLAKSASSEHFFFFLAGPIPYDQFSDSEIKEINFFINHPHDNVYYHSNYIDEGAKINAVISSLDILFLVYDNFKSSSNFSTKAVLFNKPVLATNKFWIGEVTLKYNLGIIVEEGDTNSMVEGLSELKILIDEKKFSPDNRGYLEKNGEQCLSLSFRQVLIFP